MTTPEALIPTFFLQNTRIQFKEKLEKCLSYLLNNLDIHPSLKAAETCEWAQKSVEMTVSQPNSTIVLSAISFRNQAKRILISDQKCLKCTRVSVGEKIAIRVLMKKGKELQKKVTAKFTTSTYSTAYSIHSTLLSVYYNPRFIFLFKVTTQQGRASLSCISWLVNNLEL